MTSRHQIALTALGGGRRVAKLQALARVGGSNLLKQNKTLLIIDILPSLFTKDQDEPPYHHKTVTSSLKMWGCMRGEYMVQNSVSLDRTSQDTNF
jgi:hypothetical protein